MANARFLHTLIEVDVGISPIQLSDHLHSAACAADPEGGSPALPFGTTDSADTGTGSSSASEQTANHVSVCVGSHSCSSLITAQSIL